MQDAPKIVIDCPHSYVEIPLDAMTLEQRKILIVAHNNPSYPVVWRLYAMMGWPTPPLEENRERYPVIVKYIEEGLRNQIHPELPRVWHKARYRERGTCYWIRLNLKDTGRPLQA